MDLGITPTPHAINLRHIQSYPVNMAIASGGDASLSTKMKYILVLYWRLVSKTTCDMHGRKERALVNSFLRKSTGPLSLPHCLYHE